MPPTRKPKAPSTQTAPEALEDHRTRLLAIRDRLTAELATAPAAYVASISRQLQLVLGELLLQPSNEQPSELDRLIMRRRDRLQAEGIPTIPTRISKEL